MTNSECINVLTPTTTNNRQKMIRKIKNKIFGTKEEENNEDSQDSEEEKIKQRLEQLGYK